jgi:DNA-directed RNA polymerase I subunit RPA49
MKRSVKALETAVLPARDAPAPAAVDYKTAQNLLGESFGTKKRRQAIHSLEKNQIDMVRLEASSATFINRAIDSTIVSRLPTPEPSVTSSSSASSSSFKVTSNVIWDPNSVLPPYRLTADKPEDIYPLDLMIPEDVWMALPAFEEEAAFSELAQPVPFVAARVQQSGFTRMLREDRDRLFRLVYLNMLIKLHSMKEAQWNSGPAVRQACHGLEDPHRLLSLFSEEVQVGGSSSTSTGEETAGKRRYKLPQLCKDRLISYICILALHLDGGMRTNLTELALDLSLSLARMTQYFRALGCTIDTRLAPGEAKTVSSAKGGRALQAKFARLTAPLTFPKPSLGKR